MNNYRLLRFNFFNINIYLVIILFFLLLLFIGDGVSKYLVIQGNSLSRISLVVRFLFEIVIITYLLKNIKRNTSIYISAIALLLITFVLGQFLIENENNLIENFISFNKYIYLFLVFAFLQKILLLSDRDKNKIYNLLTNLFILNMIFVSLGLIFELNFFKSFHDMNYRFGYNGVFLAGNESSFVLISIMSLFYFKAFYEDGSKILLLLFIFISMLSGMKAIYAFIMLLLLFHISYKMKKIHFLWIIPIILYTSSIVLEYIMNEEFQLLIAFFIRVAEEHGFMYMLMGGRQEILENEFIVTLENWTLLNFFIGGSMIKKYIIEMDLFDLLLFFGGFGSVIYSYLFYKAFIQKLLWHKFFTFFIFSILILAFFGGHFLTSPTSAVYFTLTIIYFQNYRLHKHEKNIIN